MLSDDRGELREIATDRYGADTSLCNLNDTKVIWKHTINELIYKFYSRGESCIPTSFTDYEILRLGCHLINLQKELR